MMLKLKAIGVAAGMEKKLKNSVWPQKKRPKIQKIGKEK